MAAGSVDQLAEEGKVSLEDDLNLTVFSSSRSVAAGWCI